VHEHGARFDVERAGHGEQWGQSGRLVGQVGGVQQEDELVAGGSVEPSEGQRRVSCFEIVAVVANFNDQEAVVSQVLLRLAQDDAREIEAVFA